MLAAKGVVPGLKPPDVLSVVVALSHAEDAKLAGAARQTLDSLPPPLLEAALSADLVAPVVAELAERYGKDPRVLPKLLSMKSIEEATLVSLAAKADEVAGELIATNEVLLLKHPAVIEKLYMNKRVRMSTADRLIELAVRNGIELDFPAFKQAAQAILTELIPEPTEEPTFDDVLFKETEAIAARTETNTDKEDVCETDEDGEEKVVEKCVPLYAKIQQMNVTQKIRRAMLGNGAERMLLIRDTNRLVAEAAAKSPRMTEAEAARISASRAVSEDVLRILALNRDFTRNYQVKLNLTMNPRCPFTFASRMIPHLRDNDLKSLSKSKSVPQAIVVASRQQLARKTKGK